MSKRPPRYEPTQFDGPESDGFDDPRPPGRHPAPRAKTAVWPWILLALALAGAAFGVVSVGIPMWDQLHAQEQQLASSRLANDALQSHVTQLEAVKGELEQARDSLARELEGKTQDLRSMEAAQEELARSLHAEVSTGDVTIRGTERGELVVELVDTILFDSGEAALRGAGKNLLRRVADPLVRVPGKIIEVRGHTDAVPVSGKLRRQFATNWELSTQRATNVVRFLQEDCAVPGERLIAAGFSQYHPAAANSSRRGRANNRRIEVVLLPRLQGG